MTAQSLPIAEAETGLEVLKTLAKERSLLSAMTAMREHVGPAFQITMPGFKPAVLVGPDAARQILVSERKAFQWRTETDPVTKLLRHGVLVEDGETHRDLRSQMEPVLVKRHVMGHIPVMQQYTDQVLNAWASGDVRDMLVEMRRAALLIFAGTLFDVDMTSDVDRLWQPILRSIKFISPGLWIVWPNMPRFGYQKALNAMDDYLYDLIRARRLDPRGEKDLIGKLIRNPQMSDDLIRDQLLTMLIAGHDTSTALLAWALHLLALHPHMLQKVVAEVDQVIGDNDVTAAHIDQLVYMDQIIKETLRLYPPIHVGNRLLTTDREIAGYQLQGGMRVMLSIYLTHRDERYWDNPDDFIPERFAKNQQKIKPFSYIPFGGGPRTCIGAAFAQVEAKVVLARILQKFALQDTGQQVNPYMGATLEPHPGVFLQVTHR